MNSFSECKAIAELDLDPIKVKLMHKESGEGWTLEQASAAENEYRRFLYLMKTFPNEAAAPLAYVDTFWHYHILDTLKYAQDCQAIFGYFLHHFPYVGLRGDEDLVAHKNMGERMRVLYEEAFGESYPSSAANDQDAGGKENTAFSTNVAKTAFSTRITGTAFSTRIASTAFSTRVTNTAFSTNVAKAAFSTNVAKTAFSTNVSKTAFSTNVAKTGFSTNVAKTAFSTRIADAALDTQRAAGDCNPERSAVTAFFSVRPRLEIHAE